MTIQADLIYQPISGQYHEKHFETPQQDFTVHFWTWALFTKTDGTEWAASFRCGTTDTTTLTTFLDTPYVFVVAGGQGYFVNAETEELVKHTTEESIREFASNANKSLVMFADIWNIFIVDNSLDVKKVNVPFEFSFVWFKQVTGDVLKIEYEDGYTGDLKVAYLDTKTLEFTTGEYQRLTCALQSWAEELSFGFIH